jgi:hypothetical protein
MANDPDRTPRPKFDVNSVAIEDLYVLRFWRWLLDIEASPKTAEFGERCRRDGIYAQMEWIYHPRSFADIIKPTQQARLDWAVVGKNQGYLITKEVRRVTMSTMVQICRDKNISKRGVEDYVFGGPQYDLDAAWSGQPISPEGDEPPQNRRTGRPQNIDHQLAIRNFDIPLFSLDDEGAYDGPLF